MVKIHHYYHRGSHWQPSNIVVFCPVLLEKPHTNLSPLTTHYTLPTLLALFRKYARAGWVSCTRPKMADYARNLLVQLAVLCLLLWVGHYGTYVYVPD